MRLEHGTSEAQPAERHIFDEARWALRVAGGALLGIWGLTTLHPAASWFTNAMGLALVASGAMLMTRRLASLALLLLVPVGLHILLHGVLFGW